MKIEHISMWVENINRTRDFYMKYFELSCNEKYENTSKGFSSYFLSFTSGARIEIMQKLDVIDNERDFEKNYYGFAHFAISVGSETKVDSVTHKLKSDGFTVLDGPRKTGDGYYESVVLDPENNRVEITVYPQSSVKE